MKTKISPSVAEVEYAYAVGDTVTVDRSHLALHPESRTFERVSQIDGGVVARLLTTATRDGYTACYLVYLSDGGKVWANENQMI